MRKIFMIMALLLAYSGYTHACTNLIVGKKASTDGSVFISYSADAYTLYGELYHWTAKNHEIPSKLKVYEWVEGKYLGEINQVEQTYNVVGNINEHQLSIAETTFGGRKELVNTEGIMDYGSLIYICLQRARTAREAITVMTDLVKEYGYYSSGESFSIADPNEVWIMEMIGKGEGKKGAVWVAVRIPDDCISAHANQARIQKFSLNDPENCLYSDDVISFAKEKKYYTGNDENFSFAQAYAPLDFGAQRFCEARVWSFFNKYNKDMAKYLSYAKGETQDPMPLYIKPDRKLSMTDVKEMMRDHYEGTELDWSQDVGAGPYNSPYRWAPLSWELDGEKYCNERPIATQQSAFVFVAQMRNYLPNPVGGILWFGADEAGSTVFTPMYCSITDTPECYKEGNGDLYNFSWTSSFWINNWVANMVYNRYSQMYPDLREKQLELENKFLAQQGAIEKEAVSLYNEAPSKAIAYLTNYSFGEARKTFDEWKKLGEFLLIKYMDGIVRKEENGEFVRNAHGMPSSPERPGYPDEYKRKVIEETGNKYKVLY